MSSGVALGVLMALSLLAAVKVCVIQSDDIIWYSGICRCLDGNVYLWDRNGESLLETLSGHGGGSVNTVAWSPNNHSLASCSDDHTIRIWEIPSSGSA